MTADVELLPLPVPMQVLGDRGRDAAEAWCRANVEANTEALRAERDLFRDETIELVKDAERLAEALRDYFDDPHADAEATLRKLAALLHPTAAQENDDA